MSVTTGTVVLRCKYHCSGCDRHFRSLDSFDMHRRGTGVRHCVVPAGEKRLAVLTRSGACEIVSPSRSGVVVWTLTSSLPSGLPRAVPETASSTNTTDAPSRGVERV